MGSDCSSSCSLHTRYFQQVKFIEPCYLLRQARPPTRIIAYQEMRATYEGLVRINIGNGWVVMNL